MFTGLVETVGELVEQTPTGGGVRLRIESTLARELVRGDSLAVNGVCLTVILAEADTILMEIGPETLRVTTLGSLERGTRVNLERPLRADGRIGGHIVLGHVDAIGRVGLLSFPAARIAHAENLQVVKGRSELLAVADLDLTGFEGLVMELDHRAARRADQVIVV